MPSPLTTREKAALRGTRGSPRAQNRFVTDDDPRNTNARAPSAHATSHQVGSSDSVFTVLTADPVNPPDDAWWVVRQGLSISVKTRIGGVTYTLALIEGSFMGSENFRISEYLETGLVP